jgi:tetratricopeptide (TPR) repeat protein
MVLLVALGVTGLTMFERMEQKQQEQQHLDTTMKQAAVYDHLGQYQEEAKVLQKYLKSNPPKPYRYRPLMRLGDLAYNQRQDGEALADYQQAVADNDGKASLTDAQSMAMAAAAKGDNVAAIKYYRLAIKLTDAKPGVGNNIDEFKLAITNLGGTP